MSKSNLRAVVVENVGGMYLPLAVELSKYFSKMYYHTAYQSPFPYMAPDQVGTGYVQIEVIRNFWDKLDQFDVVIFPDIYFEDWGVALKKLGKLVWGGGPSEDIETNRNLFYGILERLYMPNGEYQTITGIQKLKQYLKNKKNVFVKVSYFRGQFETFNWINQQHNGVQLDEIEYNLGPLGDTVEFIVQSPIKSDAEVGYDGYAVNGKLPTKFIQGIEIKNAGYLGKADSYSTAPEPITQINDKFEPALVAYKHTGFYSSEVRYDSKSKQSYYIDPCMRAGSPPSNTYLSMIDNWDQIIVEGAKGNLIEPHFKAKYGCEIILKSSYVNHNFLPISFPSEYKDNIKLKGSFIKEGIYNIIPFQKVVGYELEEIGSVVVIGNDYNQILKEALNIASKVEAYDLRYEETALEKALEQMNNLEDKLKFKF